MVSITDMAMIVSLSLMPVVPLKPTGIMNVPC